MIRTSTQRELAANAEEAQKQIMRSDTLLGESMAAIQRGSNEVAAAILIASRDRINEALRFLKS